MRITAEPQALLVSRVLRLAAHPSWSFPALGENIFEFFFDAHYILFSLLVISRCLSGIGAGGGLDDLGALVTSSVDSLTSRVVHVGDILVLELSTLPDLDFAAATEDTNAHSREKVVGGVRVVVDTAVEDGSGILTNGRGDKSLATGVLLDEVGNVVDDTSNGNEGLSVLGLGDEVVPVDNGELLQGNTPVEGSTLLVELLLELLDTALLDLVLSELLEVIGHGELLPDPDGPLGGVILVPLDGVSVIGGELVVEVVVSLTEGNESGDDVITGRVSVVEGLVSEPVGKGVDTEGSLLDKANSKNTGVDEATKPVTPAETSNDSGEDQAHGENALDVVAVLPDDNGVLVEIGDVGSALALRVLLEDHPADVGIEETLANGVGVLLSIGVTVVSSVAVRPPSNGSLNGTGTNGSEVNSEEQITLVRAVRPKTMVT